MEATRMERPEKRTTTKVYYLYNELSARIVACLHKNGPMFQIELANELRSTNVIRYYFDRLLKKKKIRRKYLSKGKMTEAIYFLRKDIRLMNILDYLGKHAMVLSSDIPKVAQAIKSTPRDVKMDLIFLAQTGRPMRMELRRIKKIKGKKTVETNQLYYLYDEEAAKVIRFLYINGPFLQSELARKFGMELMHANQLTVKMAKRGNIKRRNVGLPQKPINLVYLPMDEALAKEVKTQYAGRGRLSVVGDNHRGRAKTTQGVK